MGEYAINACVDKDGARALRQDSAVFVRRVDPPLQTVYTIVCDPMGRARPWQETRVGRTSISTRPIQVSTLCTYLAVWIPASELSQQGNVASGLARIGRDPRYEFRPAGQDERLRRIQAARWQGGAPALSPSDAALMSVLSETGLSSIAPNALIAAPPVRRELARELIQELQDIKEREAGARFVLGSHDAAGMMRERLLTNPQYSGGDAARRVQMIEQWQERLQPTAR